LVDRRHDQSMSEQCARLRRYRERRARATTAQRSKKPSRFPSDVRRTTSQDAPDVPELCPVGCAHTDEHRDDTTSLMLALSGKGGGLNASRPSLVAILAVEKSRARQEQKPVSSMTFRPVMRSNKSRVGFRISKRASTCCLELHATGWGIQVGSVKRSVLPEDFRTDGRDSGRTLPVESEI
jgi:hypothetical protein